ncbi:MAG: PilC/PilY family type IV pilus protein, partial [Comamonas sp.]
MTSRPPRLRTACQIKRPIGLLACAGLLALAGLSMRLHAQSGTTLPSEVALTGDLLYASNAQAKPTLTLALSVEEPTVGAQYLSGVQSATTDDSYSPTATYIGYFDAQSCYTYNNHTDASLRRFDRSGAGSGTSGHECGGSGFSGNFMNWASSSAVDILRMGLTGGDRVVDTASLTVLQRAVLSTVRPERFWNGVNFPAKILKSSLAAGAVPSALIGRWSGDVHIANCLDRIHFGTEATGSCDSPGNNANLGVPVLGASSRYTFCAHEGETCSFTGNRTVRYGAQVGSTLHFVDQAFTNSVRCTTAALGVSDPYRGQAKSCYVADPEGSVLSADTFFYARVQVCEQSGSDLADPRTSYCQRYPSGYHKPVGNLQKYSDRMRVAVFGYLIDNTQARYGGVLRAPMRFVGARHFDNAGVEQSGTNPTLEWKVETGQFIANPDQAQQGRSGAINYLNQFGRTGDAGAYKLYDPVAELYYESLRYLQGLDPTPAAHQGATEAMAQGFPVHTTWTDPHAGLPTAQDYSCVRNNILVIGDQNAAYDKHVPGNTGNTDGNDGARSAQATANEPDFYAWTNRASQLDGRGSLAGSVFAPNSFFTARAGYFMAGMAYWAHVNDIRGTGWSDGADQQRPGMRVTTYMLDVNERGFSSNASFRHASPFFLAAKYGGFTDSAGSQDPASSGNSWARAGQPGEARTYYLASSAQDVLDGLDEIFARIAAEANTIAGGALSTSQLGSAATGYLYRAQIDATQWSGDVVATALNTSTASGTTALTIGSSAWSAANQLATRGTARQLVVGNRDRARAAASRFSWSDIEDDLKTHLGKAGPSAAADDLGPDRLAYLAGDRTHEGSTFRARASLLGDIINAGVVLAGAPSADILDAGYYASTLYKTPRAPTLYVGANDGMLHAFDAATGDELFGYIPSWVGDRLSLLASPTYMTSGHQSFVDATPAVAEAQVGSDWKTVLVSGTGAGGQGVFALDVSAPTNFSADDVLWEFTDQDDPALGHVVGAPQILKFAVQDGTSVAYKWFAAVAGGVNNHADDGHASATGAPALFLLDLAHDGRSAWVEGRDYHKIELPLATGETTAPGVLNFTPMLGAQGQVLRLYA